MANDRLGFRNWRGDADLDEHNSGGSFVRRSRGVHGDAKRAVVGNRIAGVEMGNLDDNEQSHDGKTQDCYGAQSTGLSAAVTVKLGLESSQTIVPSLKDTQNLTLRCGKEFTELVAPGSSWRKGEMVCKHPSGPKAHCFLSTVHGTSEAAPFQSSTITKGCLPDSRAPTQGGQVRLNCVR